MKMNKKRYFILLVVPLIILPVAFLGRYHIYDFCYDLYQGITRNNSYSTFISYNDDYVDSFKESIETDDGADDFIKNNVESEHPSESKKKIEITSKSSFFNQVDVSRGGEVNVVYEIKSEFDLQGQTIRIPTDCELLFDGGCLKNGVLLGSETSINSKKGVIFKNIKIEGSWVVEHIYSSWFEDIHDVNALKKLIALSSDKTHNDIYVEKGDYFVAAEHNGDEILQLKSQTNAFIDGIIYLEPNEFDDYQVIRVESKQRVRISGTGSIIGDRYQHLSALGESGHGIVIRRSSDIMVSGLTIKDFWGDGIAIGGLTGSACEKILIEKCNIRNSRRNGISIVHANDFEINKCAFYGNEGTSPERAIDIEPNRHCFCTNGIIQNNEIVGKYGISTALEGMDGNFIKNLVIKGNTLNCSAGGYTTPYGRAITLLGDPENVTVDSNIIQEGGLSAGSSLASKNIVLTNNTINGKLSIGHIRCENNEINSIAIQCSNSVFLNNEVSSNSYYGSGNGETALVANTSIVKNNTFYLSGDKYSFDCPITSRRDSEIENNTINISEETTVRYLVRVVSGSKTIIRNNKPNRELKVLDYGIGTIIEK